MHPKIWRRRDLTIISDTERHIVMACDSCGGVGEKPGDVLSIAPYYVGRLTSRVALTEVLCTSAQPVALANGVCAEMQPTGAEIIRGIRDELTAACCEHVGLNGSTEENFQTTMTGTGITVVGIASALRFDPATAGDRLLLLGQPAVAAAVELNGGGFYHEIRELLSLPGVRELVPVGSKGIRFEAETLAALNGLRFIARAETLVDLTCSAGPATCLLVLCDPATARGIQNTEDIGAFL